MTELCRATIRGIAPYSPSRAIEEDKRKNEDYDEFEKRTWRGKAHADENGQVLIPFMCFKKALDAAARFTPRKIKGRGAQTYGAQMVSGIIITQPLVLNTKIDDLVSETFWCSITGDKRGVGGRVPRTFPMIYKWGGAIEMYVVNPTVSHTILETYLEEAGMFIGVGRFRAEVGGMNGRFVVDKVEWSDASLA